MAGNSLATVLPLVLACLEPQERLALRRCRRAFLTKRARIEEIRIESDLLERFGRRADSDTQQFDIEQSLSVVGSGVTRLVLHEPQTYGSLWPEFRRTAFASLTIENKTHGQVELTGAVYSVIGQLESLTTTDVAFPKVQYDAPNLSSYKAAFSEVYYVQHGVFPKCPRLASLTLSIEHEGTEHESIEHEQHSVSHRSARRCEFACNVLACGLRGWLKKLAELRSLRLDGDGQDIVFIEDLPAGVRDLRLSGLGSLATRNASSVWPALARMPLQSLYLSARETSLVASGGARLLRNATVVLRTLKAERQPSEVRPACTQ